MKKGPKELLKLLRYILERSPEEFGLLPDAMGYIKIKDLLKALNQEHGWRHVRRAHIDEVRLTQPDAPFQIDGAKIRSRDRQHLPPLTHCEIPPKLLYTCIRRRAYPAVKEKGLKDPNPPSLLLSRDRETALKIGRRIDMDPVLLTIHTGKTDKNQTRYYHFRELLYHADSIPPDAITGPALPKEKNEKPPKEKETAARSDHPGTFILPIPDVTDFKADGRRKRERKMQSRLKEKQRSRRKKEKKIDKGF